jgi:transposase
MTQADALVQHATGNALLADMAFDSQRLERKVKRKGMKFVVRSNPTRKHKRRIDFVLYRQRYKVETFFHDLKRFRAIATRYEKTATNFLALAHVACIFLWLI